MASTAQFCHYFRVFREKPEVTSACRGNRSSPGNDVSQDDIFEEFIITRVQDLVFGCV